MYAGVCRDGSEPATACAVAAALGVGRDCAVYDLSNACLGVLSGIVDVANRIELGQIKAGYCADLVLLDGDPLAYIRIFQDPKRILAVMKDGKFAKRDASLSDAADRLRKTA